MQTVCQHQKGGHCTSKKSPQKTKQTNKKNNKKNKLKIEKQTNILTSEANLQPRQTSMTDHFCENSQRLEVVSYFHRKAPSQMLVWAPNMPLNLI